ncbi:Protein LKAAEAR1 [Trichoplax sp. H2]|nr:Protein LKAAEAR1 [Trichoplax sp. H2]|eukprot:RDD47775.1 Protein LKAAEAR1 [Trichoplax sp. H2]
METGNKELILINNQRRKMAAQASNVKLPSLNRQRKYNDDSDDEAVPVTRFRPKNRKKIKPSQWKKLTDLEKSRYMAFHLFLNCFALPKYEPPTKEALKSQKESIKRIRDAKAKLTAIRQFEQSQFDEEKEKHSQLIGQLKAAEARNRLRLMRIRYENNREAEMNHLIACQPTSLRAIRLQTLVPPRPKPTQFDDLLDKLERVRVENIIEDDRELTITRELTRAI